MATTLHTLMDIFGAEFEDGREQVRLEKIVIPMVQRDYAQGRKGTDIKRVRERFLEALYQAVTHAPITLDFVYGDIDAEGIMTPLDGQQRLTTLFLLHWYAAKKEGVEKSEYQFLERFSYETRYSARDFCSLLIRHPLSSLRGISEEIVDQPWFPLDWNQDPTISAMLLMLDSIGEKFADVPDLWERLKGKAICFYFLPIKDMGLTDELYIKMNSRGKPLTVFEHFKAEMEHRLQEADAGEAKRIAAKVDLAWTDMLWSYRSGGSEVGEEFLRYFHFICDVICYRNGDSPQGRSNDAFDLWDEYFGQGNPQAMGNIRLLESYFDCWLQFPEKKDSDVFFEGLFSYRHEPGKIKIEERHERNLFEGCLHGYDDAEGKRAFTLNKLILLYAVVSYLLHREEISDGEFLQRLRVVNNLVQNSEFEISDSEKRAGGNRMPKILMQVDSIICEGKIDSAIETSFNASQLLEEQEKMRWVEGHAELAESLYELEDHDLLYGQIGIVGLERPEYFSRFQSLFGCDYDAVGCALLAVGNYSQKENGWRYQMGSPARKSWRNLFHKSSVSGFEQTKKCLHRLLSKHAEFTDELLWEIAESYLEECRQKKLYDWRYYFIKYEEFRPARYGKYIWDDLMRLPYEMMVMWTERNLSQNAYQPFLMAVDSQHILRDDFGRSLFWGDSYTICENHAYVTYDNETEEVIEEVPILQNEEGIDREDRIQKYLRRRCPEISTINSP